MRAAAIVVARDAFWRDERPFDWAMVVPLMVPDPQVALGDWACPPSSASNAGLCADGLEMGRRRSRKCWRRSWRFHVGVLKTEGNLNNLIGMPMTILGIDATHQAAVPEMGMNARGEIAALYVDGRS